MSAESAPPIPIHGLGWQLRDMANDPTSGLYMQGEWVRRLESLDTNEPPFFIEVRQKVCATTGVAQVIYFPRHLQR